MPATVSTRLAVRVGCWRPVCTAVYLKLAHYHDMVGLQREVAGFEDLLVQFPQIRETKDARKLAEALLERWLKRPRAQSKPPPQAGGQAGQQSDQRRQGPGESGKDTAQEQSDGQAEANPDRRAHTNMVNTGCKSRCRCGSCLGW